MHVELAARTGELGRQPRSARKSDAVPNGTNTYRFLAEYFDYAPARVPPQWRWRIYGLGLRDGILKAYYETRRVLLGIKV